MKRIIRHITAWFLAGRKTVGKAKSKKSYSLYDTADVCPLHIYISALCDNELSKLIIKGEPDNDVLLYTLACLTAEFSALSGDSRASSINNSIRKIHLQKTNIDILTLAYNMICVKDFRCIDELKNHGIRINTVDSDEELQKVLKLLMSKIAERNVRLKEEEKRFTDLTNKSIKSGKSGKATVQDFNNQIAIISKHTGFHLNKNIITLAEYASYVKQYNNSVDNGKH